MKDSLRSKLLHSRFTRISGDFVINILASVIYTFARQIVVFPLLAARLGDQDYGTLLTISGLGNICVALVGTVLNNIRLMQDSRYEEQGVQGDFNLLCLLGSLVAGGLGLVICRSFSCSGLTTVLFLLYLMASCAYHYAAAFFRLELNFKRILIANVLVSAAYVAATPLLATATLWPAVFLIGESVGLIYVSCTTPFLREPLTSTPLMGETLPKFFTLMLSSSIGNILMYADRMLIYPLLGAESVSYYSVASFFGKSAGIIMTPISGVLLGYFAQKNFRASKKLFMLINGISLGCLAVFLVVCRLVGPWFTELLYPTLYQQALPYLLLANLGAVIGIAANMATPMVLKCCNTRWLLLVQTLYAAAYLTAVMRLVPSYGLTGFCFATIIANTVQLLALYLIGLWKF